MSSKKFNRLEQERFDTMRLIQRLENELSKTEEERVQLIEEDVLGRAEGKEIQQSRRMRGCLDRLVKLGQDLSNARTRLTVIQDKQKEETGNLRQSAMDVLNHAYSEQGSQADRCRERQKKLWAEYQATIPEMTRLNHIADRKKGIIQNLQKMKDEEVLMLLQNPGDQQCRKVNDEIVEALGVLEPWRKAQDKYQEQERIEREKAARERDKEIAYNKQFRENALRICRGEESFPQELSQSYTAHSIPLNVLEYYLKIKAEQQKVVKS